MNDISNKIKNLLKPVMQAGDFFFRGTDKVTAGAPHIVDNLDLKRYMSVVIIALLPSTLAAIYHYGWRALAIIIVSYVFGGLTEVAFAIFRKSEIYEGFLVTGLIFPLVLPPTVPLWIVAVGVVFGVFFGKEVFGGTGRNIFNPALVGRIFITIAFPVIMSAGWVAPITGGLGGLFQYQADAVSAATPLMLQRAGIPMDYSYMDLLLGGMPGSMGETFRLGIIVGGIFLMATKVSNWRIPISYIGSVIVLSGIGSALLPLQVAPPLFQVLTGGLLFGAFFMASDPVSTPFTKGGKWIFGILLGFFTVLIRSFSGYVEGVMFSIILMNAFSHLIDIAVLKVRYRNNQLRE